MFYEIDPWCDGSILVNIYGRGKGIQPMGSVVRQPDFGTLRSIN